MPAGLMWRYSLRWGLPHKPCPGAFELAAAEVVPGQPCPQAVAALWQPGAGYVVSIDFQQPESAMRPWSKDAKARLRQRNLTARLQRQAPLFVGELFSRETARRPAYFAGESIQHAEGSDDAW
jgi:hypothetical protein